MSGATATLSTIDHRKCFCCISEQQCYTNFLVSVDFKRCSGSESLRHLSSTLSAIPKMFLSVCRSFMPGCQRCHLRLKASVQGLENNIRRYRDSLAMHDAFLAQCKLLLFHTAIPHLRSVSDSPFFAVSSSHFPSGVVRARNKMQRGTWWNVVSLTSRKLLPDTRSVLRVSSCCTGETLATPRQGKCLWQRRLTRVLLDAELLTVLRKISHIFFVKGYSEPNVNSRPFHWSRDFECWYLGRSHSAFCWPWRPSRACTLKTKVSVSSGKDWLLTLRGSGVYEDVFYVYKYNPNCFRCAELFYLPGSTGTGAADPTTHLS